MSGGLVAALAPVAEADGPAVRADERNAVTAPDDAAPVARGGQEPVEYQAHDDPPRMLLKVVTA